MSEPITVRFWRDIDGRVRATVLDEDGSIEIRPADHSGTPMPDGVLLQRDIWFTLRSTVYQVEKLLHARWGIK